MYDFPVEEVGSWDVPVRDGNEQDEHYQYYVTYSQGTGQPLDGVPTDWITAEEERPDIVWMPWRQTSISDWWKRAGSYQLDYQTLATMIPIQQQGVEQ